MSIHRKKKIKIKIKEKISASAVQNQTEKAKTEKPKEKKEKKKEERKVRDPRRDGDYERLSESARGREAAPSGVAVRDRERDDPRRRLREREPRSAQPSETHDLRERDP